MDQELTFRIKIMNLFFARIKKNFLIDPLIKEIIENVNKLKNHQFFIWSSIHKNKKVNFNT